MKKLPIVFLILLLTTVFTFAQDRLDEILKNKNIKVCIWTEYYGISFLDQRTQKIIGIDSDLAKELAKDLNVNLEFVESSFRTFMDDLNENRCDIAMFAIGNTETRRKKVRFTTPHLSSDIYAVTTKSNNKIKQWEDIDKRGIVVAVAKGTYHEPVMKEKLKNAELLLVNGFHERSQEVLAGRADLFITDYPYGKRMIEKTDWARLIIPKTQYHMTPYAWAMKYGNEKFFNRVEKFITDIKKDGRLLNLAEKNGLAPIVKLD
jgi:ABC-type amino acid transport substrate-binding protein